MMTLSKDSKIRFSFYDPELSGCKHSINSSRYVWLLPMLSGCHQGG